jgi:hypothetical protein
LRALKAGKRMINKALLAEKTLKHRRKKPTILNDGRHADGKTGQDELGQADLSVAGTVSRDETTEPTTVPRNDTTGSKAVRGIIDGIPCATTVAIVDTCGENALNH